MIKLKKIVFDETGFRNLRDININISPRITVISGHNGIGKSTILGLIANGSEHKVDRTILGGLFRSDFSEIFYLDYQGDYKSRVEGPSRASMVYEVESKEIVKECAVSAAHKTIVQKKHVKPFMEVVDRSELNDKQKLDLSQDTEYIRRMRIIPRTKPSKDVNKDFLTKHNVGQSAKIRIPTLYLGMSRITPIGEFVWNDINHKQLNIDSSTANFVYNFFNSVIPFRKNNDSLLFSHSFGQSNKQSAVPNFGHSSLTISLGQDSLSSIATAIASFKRLKKILGDTYPGGILVIDEVEAGLHPIAQKKLIDQLKKHAHLLDLQIIMTSHSLIVIKEILDHENYDESKDSVIYMMDTNLPTVMENSTYIKIENDMLLRPYSPPIAEHNHIPTIDVYFEDDEALDFMNGIFESLSINNTYDAFGKKMNLISANLGCSILLKLSGSSDYFLKTLIVVDADTTEDVNKNSAKDSLLQSENVIKLPVDDEGSDYYQLPPDKLAYYFIFDKYNNINDNREFWRENTGTWFTSDYYMANMYDLRNGGQKAEINTIKDMSKFSRKDVKKWYKQHRLALNELKIFKLWADENTEVCKAFITDLASKIDRLST